MCTQALKAVCHSLRNAGGETQSNDLLLQAWPGGFHLGIYLCYQQLWQPTVQTEAMHAEGSTSIVCSCCFLLYSHTQAFRRGAFEDPPAAGQLLGNDGEGTLLLANIYDIVRVRN